MSYGDSWKSDWELRREKERLGDNWHHSDVHVRWESEDRIRSIDYELSQREDRRREEEEAEERRERRRSEERQAERMRMQQEEEYYRAQYEQQQEEEPEPIPDEG